MLVALALVQPAGAQEHRGGVLRLLALAGQGSVDPQINYTGAYWQVFTPVYDGLVAFRKVAGPEGLTIVPDLAENVPEPEDGVRYVFRIRPGVRFSDGSLVAAADVVASFRRIFRVGSPTSESFFGTIEGAAACIAQPATCELPGVRAEGEVVTITLTRPDPEFLQKLALPHAAVLPAGVVQHDTGPVPLPGTGPWRIAQYDANEGFVLERNPFFRVWNADAQPDALADGARYDFGLSGDAQVTAVLNGQADWTADEIPSDRLPDLVAHPELVHINPSFSARFVALNTHLAPFDDVRVRLAFNMAVDRAVVVRLSGGSRLAAPLCQMVPPGLPGYAPYCPFAPPDLAGARRLVAESGTAGQTVTLVVDNYASSVREGAYLREVLADLGYVARVQVLSGAVQFNYIQNTNNRVQASLTSWMADYPSAVIMVEGDFGCAAFHEGSDNSPNISGFCDPALDARFATGRPEEIVAADQAMTDQAPAVMLTSGTSMDLVAPRVGGFVYHETFRALLQLMWVK